MKNFLRIIIILFIITIIIWIITNGNFFSNDSQADNAVLEGQIHEQQTEMQTQPTLEELVDIQGGNEGVIMLGGDGIPNN